MKRHLRALLLLCAFCVLSGSALAQVDSAAIEALSRLKGMDLEANPALKNAVLKILEKTRGTAQFVEIVRDFKLKGHSKELFAFAEKNPNESLGVEAFRLAVAETGVKNVGPLSLGLIQAAGNAAEKEF